MDISLIGANAGSVWNALHENGEMDLTKLKKETKLSEIEILAAIYNPQIEMFAHFKTKSSFHKTKCIN